MSGQQMGGSLVALFAGADQALDEMVRHAHKVGANAPEMLIMIQLRRGMDRQEPNADLIWDAVLAVALLRIGAGG